MKRFHILKKVLDFMLEGLEAVQMLLVELLLHIRRPLNLKMLHFVDKLLILVIEFLFENLCVVTRFVRQRPQTVHQGLDILDPLRDALHGLLLRRNLFGMVLDGFKNLGIHDFNRLGCNLKARHGCEKDGIRFES